MPQTRTSLRGMRDGLRKSWGSSTNSVQDIHLVVWCPSLNRWGARAALVDVERLGVTDRNFVYIWVATSEYIQVGNRSSLCPRCLPLSESPCPIVWLAALKPKSILSRCLCWHPSRCYEILGHLPFQPFCWLPSPSPSATKLLNSATAVTLDRACPAVLVVASTKLACWTSQQTNDVDLDPAQLCANTTRAGTRTEFEERHRWSGWVATDHLNMWQKEVDTSQQWSP